MRRRFRRDRWLTLLELAERLNLPHESKDERRRVARRIIRRLEKRDGVLYTRTHGPPRPGSRVWVSIGAIEQLIPWDPGTLTAMRDDIDGLGVRVKRAERQIAGHDRDIRTLQLLQQKAAEFADAVGQALGQSEPKASHGAQPPNRGAQDGRRG